MKAMTINQKMRCREIIHVAGAACAAAVSPGSHGMSAMDTVRNIHVSMAVSLGEALGVAVNHWQAAGMISGIWIVYGISPALMHKAPPTSAWMYAMTGRIGRAVVKQLQEDGCRLRP